MRRIFILWLVLIVSSPSFAQQEDSLMIRRIADEILRNGAAYENLRYLTKQIGPRLAGSAGMVKSEKWGLKVMQENGADRAWMQACMVPRWVRGGKDEAVIKGAVPIKTKTKSNKAAVTRALDVVALGNSLGTGPRGISAPVLLVGNFDELEAKKDQVKGKIVFYNYKFDPTFINTFNSYRDAGQYRGQGPSRAAKYGAVGVIVRSLSHATDNSPHTGSTRYDTAWPKIPAVAIGLRDA